MVYLAAFVSLIEVSYIRITVTRSEMNVKSMCVYFLNKRENENQHNDRIGIWSNFVYRIEKAFRTIQWIVIYDGFQKDKIGRLLKQLWCCSSYVLVTGIWIANIQIDYNDLKYSSYVKNSGFILFVFNSACNS
jgi:hypothetical protein